MYVLMYLASRKTDGVSFSRPRCLSSNEIWLSIEGMHSLLFSEYLADGAQNFTETNTIPVFRTESQCVWPSKYRCVPSSDRT